MITLTAEQAQQIEEALEDIVRVFKFETGTPVEALAAIRAARAQEQAEQEPSKQFHEWAIAEHEKLKQEPVCKTCEALARTVMMDQIGKA